MHSPRSVGALETKTERGVVVVVETVVAPRTAVMPLMAVGGKKKRNPVGNFKIICKFSSGRKGEGTGKKLAGNTLG